MTKIRVVTYKRKSSKEEVDREEPLARQNLLIEQARRWKGELFVRADIAMYAALRKAKGE